MEALFLEAGIAASTTFSKKTMSTESVRERVVYAQRKEESV